MIEPIIVRCMIHAIAKEHNLSDRVSTEVQDNYAVLYSDYEEDRPELYPYYEILSMADSIALASCRDGRPLNANQLKAELMYQYSQLTKTWLAVCSKPLFQMKKKRCD